MIVFDGDFFRRIFPLILSLHNAQDLVAYMKYNVILWGGGYCTKVHRAILNRMSRPSLRAYLLAAQLDCSPKKSCQMHHLT